MCDMWSRATRTKEFKTKKNPAEAGFLVAELFGDFIAFGFEVLDKTLV